MPSFLDRTILYFRTPKDLGSICQVKSDAVSNATASAGFETISETVNARAVQSRRGEIHFPSMLRPCCNLFFEFQRSNLGSGANVFRIMDPGARDSMPKHHEPDLLYAQLAWSYESTVLEKHSTFLGDGSMNPAESDRAILC